MGALLDAMGWVGETLGKPGRAVRGVLGGQGLSALGNLVPFSDTVGLTNPENDVSGRDLLQKWGMVGQDDDRLGLDDAAGFGVEALLDPTTFLGGGLGTMLVGKLGTRFGAGTRGLAGAEDALQRTGTSASRAAAKQAQAYSDSLIQRYPKQYAGINRYTNVERLDPGQTDQMVQLLRSGGRLPQGMSGAVLRRGLPQPVGFTGEAANIAPGDRMNLSKVMRGTLTPEELAGGDISSLHGAYNPRTNSIIEMRGASPETFAHEFYHALTQGASDIGKYDDLPFLSKWAAQLRHPYSTDLSVGKSFRTGLSEMLDETNSFAMENPTLMGQIGGGLKHLLPSPSQFTRSLYDPRTAWNHYANRLGGHSPFSELLYRGIGASPYAVVGRAGANMAADALTDE